MNDILSLLVPLSAITAMVVTLSLSREAAKAQNLAMTVHWGSCAIVFAVLITALKGTAA